MRWPVEAVLLGCALFLGCLVSAEKESDVLLGTIHTIVSAECNLYFSFQVLTLAYTHKRVRQTGPFTRILACTPQMLEDFSQEDMDMMNTHITPVYSLDSQTGDHYAPYNRPGGILHWLENAKPREEWVLVVDPDMIFRHPVSPETVYVGEGWARAAHYNYLEGTHNDLALRHIPEVKPRSDKHGGPAERRADEAGAFLYLRTRDMKKIAPLWMTYTKAVRADPEAWHLTGDDYAEKGKPVWISEMYGWVFGAAKADVWHILDPTLQIYAGRKLRVSPTLVHYGLTHKVGRYVFNKQNHTRFNYAKCPPWDMHLGRAEDAGLMPHPPFPHEILQRKVNRRYGELLTIEVVNTINQALCERHRRMCGISQQLLNECKIADNIRAALDREYAVLEKQICVDDNTEICTEKKRNGDCEKDFLYMGKCCRPTCGWCPASVGNMSKPRSQDGVEGFMTAQHVGESIEVRCKRLSVEELLMDVDCMRWVGGYGSGTWTVSQIAGDIPYAGYAFPAILLVVVGILLLLYLALPRRKRKQRNRCAS